MFKLVVLSALVALAVAKPSGLTVLAPAVAAYAAPIVVPSAVSHSYRSDGYSKPVVTAYAAPTVFAAAPVLEKVVAPVAVSAAVSHSYRSDVISKPLVASYAVPALAYTAQVPAFQAW